MVLQPIHELLLGLEDSIQVHESIAIRVLKVSLPFNGFTSTFDVPNTPPGSIRRQESPSCRWSWGRAGPCGRRDRRFPWESKNAPSTDAKFRPPVLTEVDETITVCVPQGILGTVRVKDQLFPPVTSNPPNADGGSPNRRHPVPIRVGLGGAGRRIDAICRPGTSVVFSPSSPKRHVWRCATERRLFKEEPERLPAVRQPIIVLSVP